MKRKVGKEPEGRSKKRKEVGNDKSLASMFAKQQAVSALNKSRDAYNAQLRKGKEMGFHEAAPAVCSRSERDTHDTEETETVHAGRGGEECGKEEECCWPFCTEG
jgi:hypothetical protein